MSKQNNSACFGSRRSSQDTKRGSAYRFKAAAVAVAMASATLAGTSATAGAAAPKHNPGNAFQQVNLVSDLPNVAKIKDPAVRNPWGIAMGPTTPIWVNNQFNPASDCGPTCVPRAEDLLTKVTLYRGANGHQEIEKVPLEVTASSPFGIVFNPTSSFVVKQKGVRAPARFLFNEIVPGPGGAPVAKVTGWSNATSPPPTVTVTKATKRGGVHLGLALVPGDTSQGRGERGPRLLAADIEKGKIDVYDGEFKLLKTPGAFKDPRSASQKLAPYNVTFLRDRVYVAYAAQNGGGALSVFTPQGRFIKRLVTSDPLPIDPRTGAPLPGDPLQGPWGMAIAPDNWGRFGGAILVGSVDSGKIHAFNRRNGHLLGTLKNAAGNPLVIPGLWGLAFGNGTIGTPRTLLFAAGIGEKVGDFDDHFYAHGLVGLIKPVG